MFDSDWVEFKKDALPSPLPLLILLAAALAVLKPPLWSGGDFLYSSSGVFSDYLFIVAAELSVRILATPGNPVLFLEARSPTFEEL